MNRGFIFAIFIIFIISIIVVSYYLLNDSFPSASPFLYPQLNNKTIITDINNISKYSIFGEKNNKLLKEIGLNKLKKCYTPCNPSFAVNSNGELLVIVRYINYMLCNLKKNKDVITVNVIATIDMKGGITSNNWKKKTEKIIEIKDYHNNYYEIWGVEDVRLFNYNNVIYYTSNIPMRKMKKTDIEIGNIINENNVHNNGLVYVEKNNIWTNVNNTEKNWVLFEDASNKLKIVYKWHPLIVCDYNNYNENITNYKYKLQKTHEFETPTHFKHLRGTTNGISIGNEIWFVCHMNANRNYKHCIVVLDNKTYKPIKYTDFFKMENKPIEFCIGFVHFNENDSFLLGYGINDCATNYICIERKFFEKIMKYI